MSATASLTIPSPKIIEKSIGCSSYLTIDIAAITSEEQRSELIKNASIIDRLKVKYLILCLESKNLHFLVYIICLYQISRSRGVRQSSENKECQDSTENPENKNVSDVFEEPAPSHVEARGEDNGREADIEKDISIKEQLEFSRS